MFASARTWVASLNEQREQVEHDGDAAEKADHANAPAERLVQDGAPFVETCGTVHQADDHDHGGQVPVNRHGKKRRHHTTAASFGAAVVVSSRGLAAGRLTGKAGPANAS